MNERPQTSLFGELRRRKVLRGAIAYLAGAWVATELREEAGDLEAAFLAARRRPFFHGLIPEQATFFQTQARLASRLGLREEAIDAYTRFLNLRSDPEPSRRAEVERARAALRELIE